MQRAQTVRELGDAMEANVAVDMETIHVHRSIDTCFEVARPYVRRSAALVSVLADAGRPDHCNALEGLRDLGQQLAEADQAREAYFAGLGHEWSNVADSLTRTADLVDGGFILHCGSHGDTPGTQKHCRGCFSH